MGGTKKVRLVKAFRIQLSETVQSLLALTLYIIHTINCAIVIFEMMYGFVSFCIYIHTYMHMCVWCLYVAHYTSHICTSIFFIINSFSIPHPPHDESIMFLQIGKNAKAVSSTSMPTNCFV